MVASAGKKTHIRLFPEEGQLLDTHPKETRSRNVSVKYISIKTIPLEFDCQAIQPKFKPIEAVHGGRSFDLISDSQEFPGGWFKIGDEEISSLYRGKNRRLVTAGRDSLRHDFSTINTGFAFRYSFGLEDFINYSKGDDK